MVNIENARTLLADVERHRKAFSMHQWVTWSTSQAKGNLTTGEFTVKLENIEEANTMCGTTLCLAGFAAMRVGWKQVFKIVHEEDDYSWIDNKMVSPEGETVEFTLDVDWEKIGSDFLGLDKLHAYRLFHHVTLRDSDHDNANEEALDALRQLANGVHPDDIKILALPPESFCCFICNEDDEDSE